MKNGYKCLVPNHKESTLNGEDVFRFDDYESFVNACNGKRTNEKSDCASYIGSRKFTATDSFEDCMQLARYGWKEGTEQAKAMISEIKAISGSLQKVFDFVYDETGDEVSVERYLDKEESHFLRFTETIKDGFSKRIIRFCVNVTTNAETKTEYIIRRGASIVALVDLFESQGIQCELTAIETIVVKNRYFEVSTVLKQAGEAVEIDRIAFAFSHPSFLRRMVFGFQETLDRKIINHYDFQASGGYGHCGECPELLSDYDLYLPSFMSGNCALFKTAKDCVKWIKETAKDFGIEFDNEERH